MSSQSIAIMTLVSAACTAVMTVVYTVATVCISSANKRSADASARQAQMMQAQTEELVKQYRESNRARITIRFGWDDAVGKYLIFKNIGLHDADCVRVSVDDSFMASLRSVFEKSHLEVLTESTIHIAAGQEFPVLVGFARHIESMREKLAKVHMTYRDGGEEYSTIANMDFSQYGFLSTVTNTRTENGQRVVERLEVKG